MSWRNEPQRHSLASRGIRTRAIFNPLAAPELYDPKLYKIRKGVDRKFIGSGLEKINLETLVDEVGLGFDLLQRNLFDDDQIYENYLDMMIRPYHVAGTNKEHLRGIIDQIINIGIEIDEVYVYGSRVTGFYIPESDIDVAVVIKPKEGLVDLFDELIDYTYSPDANLNSVLSYFTYCHREILGSEFGYGYDLFMIDEDGNHMRIDIHYVGFEEPENIGPGLKVWESK